MDNETLLILTVGSQTVLTTALGVVIAFLNTKAQNRAQMQDLPNLTSIAEAVKNRFQYDALVARAQFEAEFKLMQSLWDASRRLNRQFIESFPHPKFGAMSREGYERFTPVQIDFLDMLENSRPFISTSVFDAFMVFDGLMVDLKQWQAAQYSESEIEDVRIVVKSSFQGVEKAIRHRISDLRSSELSIV